MHAALRPSRLEQTSSTQLITNYPAHPVLASHMPLNVSSTKPVHQRQWCWLLLLLLLDVCPVALEDVCFPISAVLPPRRAVVCIETAQRKIGPCDDVVVERASTVMVLSHTQTHNFDNVNINTLASVMNFLVRPLGNLQYSPSRGGKGNEREKKYPSGNGLSS